MGHTTEHRGRGPNVYVPNTGQLIQSTCIRNNQSSKSVRYIGVFTEINLLTIIIQY